MIKGNKTDAMHALFLRKNKIKIKGYNKTYEIY